VPQFFALAWIVLCTELIAQLGLPSGRGVEFGGSVIEVVAGRLESLPVPCDRGVLIEVRLR
jgi:hypothetical protein